MFPVNRRQMHRMLFIKSISLHSKKMVKLPQARLRFHFRPFTYCGLDYFEPIMARIGRRREKRWGALFTCLIVRAIHIKLADSISTDYALMAIQRFAGRREFLAVIFIDKRTNFRDPVKN